MTHDVKGRCCGFCYGAGATMKCGKCPRAYCSRECQVKDWKVGRHKAWCGKAGEKCIDYEIREAGDKGLGLFIKRDFQRGEKILVERPAVIQHENGQPLDRDQLKNANILAATMALAPAESSHLETKFDVNRVALGDDDEDSGTGLFITFSRVIHDCLGNVTNYYDAEHGLILLVANHDISAGSEVTFSYVCNQSTMQRSLRLATRGFQCTCCVCQDPEMAVKLERSLELNRKIFELGSNRRTEQAILVGMSLIKLYDELQLSEMNYIRTYYDLFQIAITKQKTVKQGVKFIREARKHALRFYGREDQKDVQKYKLYIENPGLHRNYRCIN